MKQLGMTMPLVQSHGAASQKFIELAGDAANGILMPAGKLVIYKLLPDSDPQKAVCAKYDEEFQAKYNKPASSFGGYAYDAMGMLIVALQDAGANRDKIRDALEKTKGHIGVSGVFNMSPQDHNGLTPDAFVIVKIDKGAFVLAD
jgi:branched-chain amino acid transport system substrate-binding protein